MSIYNKDAIDDRIKASTKKISKKEAETIHSLLKGYYLPPTPTTDRGWADNSYEVDCRYAHYIETDIDNILDDYVHVQSGPENGFRFKKIFRQGPPHPDN
tara:strand:- start:794 stop:1093 length:300 start_codon:yes stop_codon:yes gene_type:complete